MYRFDENTRALLEGMDMPLAVYQLVEGQPVTVLVSNGFCALRKETRAHLTQSLNDSMFERVDPRDTGKLAQLGREFAAHACSYDVVFRSINPHEKPRVMHSVAHWQTMPDGTELAFFFYLNVTKSIQVMEGASQRYLDAQHDRFFLDSLTGLPNLNYLNEFGDETVNSLRQDGKQPMLAYFNICDMQSYNARYGTDAGNDLLRLLARILLAQFPNALVVRENGDCFLALAPAQSRARVEQEAERAQAALVRKAVGNVSGVRVGVCLLEDGDTVASSIDHARRAFKTIGDDMNNRIAWYTPTLEHTFLERRAIVERFRDALAHNLIRAFYQPIVASADGTVTYAEALARWVDPEKGMVPPAQFIPTLRHFHLLFQLDLYMVELVCKEYRQREQAGLSLVPVSVNLSAQDFDHVDMHAEIAQLLQRYNVPVDHVIIEITEEDVARSDERFRTQLERFMDSGFTVWVDDFGSGYSSLNVFTRYRFGLIKIDKSLLDIRNAKVCTITAAIVQAARKLGLSTLCEGVETEEEYRFVKETGCDFVQGFYFYKPAPLEDFKNASGIQQAESVE